MRRLDETSFAALRERIVAYRDEPSPPRSYPGHPRVALPRPGLRLWPTVDSALRGRRSCTTMHSEQPRLSSLSRLLFVAHGVTGSHARGPTPSAGGLQALELYLAPLCQGPVPPGVHHFDREGHHLSLVAQQADRPSLEALVPSLSQVEGGGLLFLLVGDLARVSAKYGDRAERFLLLEAGHLMQSLCIASHSLDLSLLPLGALYERGFSQLLPLAELDLVLYAGVVGRARR